MKPARASRNIEQTLHLAGQHHQAGRLAEAEALYRRVLAQQPNHEVALHMLGVVAGQSGHLDASIDLISRAIALNPDMTSAYGNLGNALRGKDRLEEAIAAYRKALALDGNQAETHSNLGIALRDNKQVEEAVAAYREAIRLKNNHPEAYSNLGIALQDQGKIEEAIDAYRKAIELNPKLANAYVNLGNVLKRAGRADEAVNACREGIRLNPHTPDSYGNLGAALLDQGRLEESFKAHQQALRIDPKSPSAHYNIGLLQLLQGDFSRGWAEYEWRWQMKGFPGPHREYAQPLWDGSDPAGKTILLHAEQGLGDAIQFIRYAPMLATRGAKVIVECSAKLIKLLERVEGVAGMIGTGGSLPDIDMHCPMLSLPLFCRTTLETIPANVPYLSVDPAESERWKTRLNESAANKLKVGLAWTGSPLNHTDRQRSMPLSAFAPLGAIENARFFSLQHEVGSEQAKSPPTGLDLIDWTGEFRNFNDAGMIANLDLIITVDTSVAHLAGALGRPTWVLLAFIPDWRWMLDRQDSPWYPTIKLFRQTQRGQWSHVMDRVRDGLAEMCRNRG